MSIVIYDRRDRVQPVRPINKVEYEARYRPGGEGASKRRPVKHADSSSVDVRRHPVTHTGRTGRLVPVAWSPGSNPGCQPYPRNVCGRPALRSLLRQACSEAARKIGLNAAGARNRIKAGTINSGHASSGTTPARRPFFEHPLLSNISRQCAGERQTNMRDERNRSISREPRHPFAPNPMPYENAGGYRAPGGGVGSRYDAWL